MSSSTYGIHLYNLSYSIADTQVNFDKLTLSLPPQKIGIVGDNGIGKSTLLQLIAGELTPISGSIQVIGSLTYCPQNIVMHQQQTVASVLGIHDKFVALRNVANGSINTKDYDVIGNDWNLELDIKTLLEEFNLSHVALEDSIAHFSGGQQTKLNLLKAVISKPDFMLLDEPTNNLDRDARIWLRNYIGNYNKGVIIVSHDRELLNQMDRIIEITSIGVTSYGGNYDDYQQEKKQHLLAAEQEYKTRVEALKKSKQSIQTRMERHQQNEAKGRKTKAAEIKAKGKYDKLVLKSQQGRSEKTNKRIRTQAHHKLETVNTQLAQAKSRIEIKEEFAAILPPASVPNSKVIINLKNISFGYSDNARLISELDFKMMGPERVALIGPNGCGKSTLIKLIRKRLNPDSGSIEVGVKHIAYLDQQAAILDDNETLLTNFQRANPEMSTQEAYFALAQFKFRNLATQKQAKHLSGGERVRAGLACALLAKVPPELLILDEPTNHLDLTSIAVIEQALKNYQGAMIVVSHDVTFLESININRHLYLCATMLH